LADAVPAAVPQNTTRNAGRRMSGRTSAIRSTLHRADEAQLRDAGLLGHTEKSAEYQRLAEKRKGSRG